MERLPARVELLHGWPPVHDGRELVVSFPSLREHVKRAVLRRIGLWSFEDAISQEIARFLKQRGICAVLAEYGCTGVRVIDACRKASVPLIVHFHGYDAYRRDVLETDGQRYPEMFETAAALIVVSHDMKDQLRSLGAPEGKLFYNPYGVDTTLFQGADPAQAPPLFVAVGRFVDKKAPHLTLMAFRKVVEICPDSRLAMIGDGPLLEACRQLARVWRIEKAVEFRGARSHAEVSATMQRARAFVQHSIRAGNGDSEGTPVAVLEAGASGLPVVATRHGGIKDVVIEGETGFLVDEGDVEGMAEHMLRLARDPQLARALGHAARERVRAEFSMERSISGLWRIIERAIRQADVPSEASV
ncbi:MAG: glycosyltransferase [Candidatus Micrarchaeaceae archaeon]